MYNFLVIYIAYNITAIRIWALFCFCFQNEFQEQYAKFTCGNDLHRPMSLLSTKTLLFSSTYHGTCTKLLWTTSSWYCMLPFGFPMWCHLESRENNIFYNKFSKWDNMIKYNGYLARWHLHEKTECSLHNINFALKYIYILTNIWITANCKPVAYKNNKYLARKWIGETIRALILILLTANYRPVWIGQRWSCRLQF